MTKLGKINFSDYNSDSDCESTTSSFLSKSSSSKKCSNYSNKSFKNKENNCGKTYRKPICLDDSESDSSSCSDSIHSYDLRRESEKDLRNSRESLNFIRIYS